MRRWIKSSPKREGSAVKQYKGARIPFPSKIMSLKQKTYTVRSLPSLRPLSVTSQEYDTLQILKVGSITFSIRETTNKYPRTMTNK
ncbi:MAG: hypothetical protein GX166_09035 [Clostridiaceae bacterium]|nr:hypothetical protein [Clostridiaceae bacterium]